MNGLHNKVPPAPMTREPLRTPKAVKQRQKDARIEYVLDGLTFVGALALITLLPLLGGFIE